MWDYPLKYLNPEVVEMPVEVELDEVIKILITKEENSAERELEEIWNIEFPIDISALNG